VNHLIAFDGWTNAMSYKAKPPNENYQDRAHNRSVAEFLVGADRRLHLRGEQVRIALLEPYADGLFGPPIKKGAQSSSMRSYAGF
jgi:hypothetical protein